MSLSISCRRPRSSSVATTAGKTSFIEVFFKFLGTDKASFSLDDFTLARIKELREAGSLWQQAREKRGKDEAALADELELEAIAKLRSIKLDVEFVYEESDSLAPIADLILDLDTDRQDALLRCQYFIVRPREFFKAFEDYYRAIANTETTVESLEAALAEVSSKLDGEYSSLFSAVFGGLKLFGAGRMPSLQEVKVVSELRAVDLFKVSTKVMYAHDSGQRP